MGFIKRILSNDIFKSHEKNSKKHHTERSNELILVKDFCACVNGEMNLRCGQKATLIYEEDDWFFVESMRGIQGFIPKSYFRGQVHEGVSRLSSYSSSHCTDFSFDEETSNKEFEFNDTEICNQRTYKRTNSVESYCCETISNNCSPNVTHLEEQYNNDFDNKNILEQLRNTRRLLQDMSQIELFV